MAYEAEIKRDNPSCIIFLVDQSKSMEDAFGASDSELKKAKTVADVINKQLDDLVTAFSREREVLDYYHIGVIGYGKRVGPALGGELSDIDLVPISVIANSARIEERSKEVYDGAGGLKKTTVKFPVWLDPKAENGTPMCSALAKASELVKGWIEARPKTFPPIVINISDGESTDGDPLDIAKALMGLSCADGNVLLFNVHLSSSKSKPIEFPLDESELPDKYSKLLFQMSSGIPPLMVKLAQSKGLPLKEGGKGFVFNADIVSMIKFLDIGTRAADISSHR